MARPTASTCSSRSAGSSAATTRRTSCPMANICRCGRLLSAIGLSRLAPGDLDFAPGRARARSSCRANGARSASSFATRSSSPAKSSTGSNRPDFIFNPSNDAWFGRWGPPQHLAQARLRAAEEGLPVIRSTPTGISALIDPHGRDRPVAALADRRNDRRDSAQSRLLRRYSPASATSSRWRSASCLLIAAIALDRRARYRRHIRISFISSFSADFSQGLTAFHAQLLSLHLRIGFRRPSRQGRRPDQRRDRRPVPVEGSGSARRLRDDGHHAADRRSAAKSAAGRVRRGAVQGHPRLGAGDRATRSSRSCAQTVKRIGYEQDGFHWQTAELREPPARPVGAHRAGRRRRPATRTRARATRASCSVSPATRLRS